MATLLPPRVLGPLSECSKLVRVEGVQPGATVSLVRVRGTTVSTVGSALLTISTGSVPLAPGQGLQGGDLVSAWQEAGTDRSDPQPSVIGVQSSDDVFNAPYPLFPLYACARGVMLGGMRPGTVVEILHDATVIAAGESMDGTADVRTISSGGFPNAGTVLTVRQRVCPKPPPPGGAAEWVIEHQLPPVEPLVGADPNSPSLRAPNVLSGMTHCSRSIEVDGVIPGAEVIVEGPGGWWSAMGPSNQVQRTVPLPVSLQEGQTVEVRQELGCRFTSERDRHRVGPQVTLPPPSLGQIDCAVTPTVSLGNLKPEAALEFEVTTNGQVATFRSTASATSEQASAPIMQNGSTVRVRQGECDVWSDWSAARTVLAISPVDDARISGTLYHCQRFVVVRNLSPMAGTIEIRDDGLGQLAKEFVTGETMTIAVAPTLHQGHHVIAIHEACGMVRRSEPARVESVRMRERIGPIRRPVYDGDTWLIIDDVIPGSTLELRDQNGLIQRADVGPWGSDSVSFEFTNLPPLRVGQQLSVTSYYCGIRATSEEAGVEYRAPELTAIIPAEVTAGSGDFILTVIGKHFRKGSGTSPGSMISFEGAGNAGTVISSTEMRRDIAGYHVSSQGTREVLVIGPGIKASGIIELVVKPAPPPPPPAPKPPFIHVTYKRNPVEEEGDDVPLDANGNPFNSRFMASGSGFQANKGIKVKVRHAGGVDNFGVIGATNALGVLSALPFYASYPPNYSVWVSASDGFTASGGGELWSNEVLVITS